MTIILIGILIELFVLLTVLYSSIKRISYLTNIVYELDNKISDKHCANKDDNSYIIRKLNDIFNLCTDTNKQVLMTSRKPSRSKSKPRESKIKRVYDGSKKEAKKANNR